MRGFVRFVDLLGYCTSQRKWINCCNAERFGSWTRVYRILIAVLHTSIKFIFLSSQWQSSGNQWRIDKFQRQVTPMTRRQQSTDLLTLTPSSENHGNGKINKKLAALQCCRPWPRFHARFQRHSDHDDHWSKWNNLFVNSVNEFKSMCLLRVDYSNSFYDF